MFAPCDGPLGEDAVALLQSPSGPGVDYGEVFTRRWVVEFILDLVGYTPDVDLGGRSLVEPSCGTGAFVVPAVERLVTSSVRHGHDIRALRSAVRAFDLLQANVERARKAVADVLVESGGLADDEAGALAGQWIGAGDFLLHRHEAASADYVVGNPPYVRLENVAPAVMDAYRRSCSTMHGRADVYVGFIERALDLLKPGGALSFICADRWMRNQYGAHLRELVTASFAVGAVVSMHDVDAFEDDVSAYPAVIVLRNERQRDVAVAETNGDFSAPDAERLSSWIRSGAAAKASSSSTYRAARVDGWFEGRDLWPSGSPSQLACIADLERRFPPLQDVATRTRVGIGVATGCDEVFVTEATDLVEADRLLPLLRAPDTVTGSLAWSGGYLVDPWNGSGLVDLRDYPRLAAYLDENSQRLRRRHVAKRRPAMWYRTIDRVDHALQGRPKLVLPDMKRAAHPVLDEGGLYPHHNLYFVVSDCWDLQVLGGLLLSDVANLFVGAYCVRMRGGTYRFQAQYIRRIRVPDPTAISRSTARSLVQAFEARDRERATGIAAALYGVPAARLPSQMLPGCTRWAEETDDVSESAETGPLRSLSAS